MLTKFFHYNKFLNKNSLRSFAARTDFWEDSKYEVIKQIDKVIKNPGKFLLFLINFMI